MSEEVQEVKRLVKELQNAAGDKAILDVLKLLKTNVRATDKLLRETKAGLAVGRLRENGNKEVSSLAKELVNKWKAEVKAGKGPTPTPKSNGAASPAAGSAPSPTPGKNGRQKSPVAPISAPAAAPPMRTGAAAAAAIVAQSPTTPASGGPPRTYKSDGVSFQSTLDKKRDKCIEMIYDALASDSNAPTEQIKQRSVAIEKKVFGDMGGSAGGYPQKMRSLYLNLKDKTNPGLRQNVVSGDLTVARFCTMPTTEMASEQRKAADKLLQEENFFKSLGAQEPEAETTAFQCGRCKQWKTRYRQAQTRSADEPMTTFVTCVNCGNRWKFS